VDDKIEIKVGVRSGANKVQEDSENRRTAKSGIVSYIPEQTPMLWGT